MLVEVSQSTTATFNARVEVRIGRVIEGRLVCNAASVKAWPPTVPLEYMRVVVSMLQKVRAVSAAQGGPTQYYAFKVLVDWCILALVLCGDILCSILIF